MTPVELARLSAFWSKPARLVFEYQAESVHLCQDRPGKVSMILSCVCAYLPLCWPENASLGVIGEPTGSFCCQATQHTAILSFDRREGQHRGTPCARTRQMKNPATRFWQSGPVFGCLAMLFLYESISLRFRQILSSIRFYIHERIAGHRWFDEITPHWLGGANL